MKLSMKPGKTCSDEGIVAEMLQQLDDDMDDAQARKALSRVARDAWEVRLDIAREASRMGKQRFPRLAASEKREAAKVPRKQVGELMQATARHHLEGA